MHMTGHLRSYIIKVQIQDVKLCGHKSGFFLQRLPGNYLCTPDLALEVKRLGALMPLAGFWGALAGPAYDCRGAKQESLQ